MAICDHRSVGVIITDASQDRFLLSTRATLPIAVAPPARHVDDHNGWEDAARTHVTDDVGLTVGGLRLVTGGWRRNRCRRYSRAPHGHEWRVYTTRAAGDPTPAMGDLRNAGWYTRGQVVDLAHRTIAYAYSEISEQEYIDQPGLEPVWLQWLVDVGLLEANLGELRQVDMRAARYPARPSVL